jgi:SAM-dependent methyltransferase
VGVVSGGRTIGDGLEERQGMVTYECGCQNNLDPDWGILRSVSKCAEHRAELERQPKGRAYYESIGCFVDGIPQCSRYVVELTYSLGVTERPQENRVALEIGCGASMYAAHLHRAGWAYFGIDQDEWAAKWTRETYGVPVECGVFPSTKKCDYPFGLILCAHALEHMPDAPAALIEMHRLLTLGGSLILIVPDDSDQVNPDHLWFFTEATLRATLERIGFTVDKMVMKKIVPHENFIYTLARKN